MPVIIHKVGERLSIAGEKCSILFIGKIHRWDDSIAYGVEWDDPSRGKHSGAIDGIEYFSTRVLNAGSFIKVEKIIQSSEQRVSFTEALYDKHQGDYGELPSIFFGEKVVDISGLKEFQQRRNLAKRMAHLSLTHCNVYTVGSLRESQIFSKIKSCVFDLDLSFNLFSSFDDVIKIAQNFPMLNTLDISGNRFQFLRTKHIIKLPGVKRLRAHNCGLEDKDLAYLFEVFASLEELECSENRLHLNSVLRLPVSLKVVNFTNNGLSSIPGILNGLSELSVNLAHNRIREVQTKCLPHVESLDISYNCIDEHAQITKIDSICPNIKNLRVNGNPIWDALDGDDIFYEIIARNGHLQVVNGSILSAAMRKEAEIYFIRQVLTGKMTIDRQSSSWDRLSKVHNIVSSGEISGKGPAPDEPKLKILKLSVKQENQIIGEVYAQPSYSVRFLKSIVARLISRRLDQFDLGYITGETIQEFNLEFSPIQDYDIRDEQMLRVLPAPTSKK
ncbi:LAMI_0E05864g1_1 [Lachancea mirantina]|uniref:LAMI_0E05864g1_1 n=1 Tax=Lachancea mirantina TaxID=1230905 RepID=A0A1G4JLG3_9SACH|nr:LAMI_0E05864g1_1 [Lachancea mirantina]